MHYGHLARPQPNPLPTWVWVAGGAAVALSAAGVVYMLTRNAKAMDQVIVHDEPTPTPTPAPEEDPMLEPVVQLTGTVKLPWHGDKLSRWQVIWHPRLSAYKTWVSTPGSNSTSGSHNAKPTFTTTGAARDWIAATYNSWLAARGLPPSFTGNNIQ